MTKIEWTNETWNPIIGCNKVSLGCDNCYAEKMAYRLMHMPYGADYQFVLSDNGKSDPEKYKNLPKWNGETHFQKSQLDNPLKWKKPRMIFVVSMGDLFHESIPFEWIDKVFEVIFQTPQHTYQILTKRPERMKKYFEHQNELLKDLGGYSPPPFIWLGVTAENQEQANKRIPILLEIPAAIRFVSIEPMLSKIDIQKYLTPGADGLPEEVERYHDWIDWVICGGESGSKARPMHPDWTRSLRDQCKKIGTPFFFKQWGEYTPNNSNTKWYKNIGISEDGGLFNKEIDLDAWQGRNFKLMFKVGKSKTGNLLEGKEHNEMPTIHQSLK